MAKKSTKVRTPNPTLHGLFITRNFSGTVVRVLTFAILVFALVLVGASATADYSGLNAFATWLIMVAVYLVFDIKYVLMSRVRPLHPRLDRVVLPVSLIFALVAVFTPIVLVTENGINVVNFWVTGAIALVCVLGVRFALLLASKK